MHYDCQELLEAEEGGRMTSCGRRYIMMSSSASTSVSSYKLAQCVREWTDEVERLCRLDRLEGKGGRYVALMQGGKIGSCQENTLALHSC
jgi:hypothetical protein